MFKLVLTNKSDKLVKYCMLSHYSETNGFVGRHIIYRVNFNDIPYGCIVGGSATRFLPGREDVFGEGFPLNSIVNNTFFHIERREGKYPLRNFVSQILLAWRFNIQIDWQEKYGDPVVGFETLVELPRTGEAYIRDGWTQVGVTKGQVCRRGPGESTDSWGGRRYWSSGELRPKLVFVKRADT